MKTENKRKYNVPVVSKAVQSVWLRQYIMNSKRKTRGQDFAGQDFAGQGFMGQDFEGQDFAG